MTTATKQGSGLRLSSWNCLDWQISSHASFVRNQLGSFFLLAAEKPSLAAKRWLLLVGACRKHENEIQEDPDFPNRPPDGKVCMGTRGLSRCRFLASPRSQQAWLVGQAGFPIYFFHLYSWHVRDKPSEGYGGRNPTPPTSTEIDNMVEAARITTEFFMMVLAVMSMPQDQKEIRIDMIQNGRYVDTMIIQREGTQFAVYDEMNGKLVQGATIVPQAGKNSVFAFVDKRGNRKTIDLAAGIEALQLEQLRKASELSLKATDGTTIRLNRSGRVVILGTDQEQQVFVAH